MGRCQLKARVIRSPLPASAKMEKSAAISSSSPQVQGPLQLAIQVRSRKVRDRNRRAGSQKAAALLRPKHARGLPRARRAASRSRRVVSDRAQVPKKMLPAQVAPAEYRARLWALRFLARTQQPPPPVRIFIPMRKALPGSCEKTPPLKPY